MGTGGGESGAVLRERAALPPPPLAGHSYADVNEAMANRGMTAYVPDERPRCPSCDSSRLRRTDHGAHYCPACSWHGASLTVPVVPRFAVGDWIAKTSPTPEGAWTGQVVRVHPPLHFGAEHAYDVALTQPLDDGNAEPVTCRRPESMFVPSERPR